MNLGELKTELEDILQDPSVRSSLTVFINDEILRISHQFELPALRLKTPATLTTTTANWQYDMATDVTHASSYVFQKMPWRVTNSANPDRGLLIHREVETIDLIDSDHDETGNDVQEIAIEDTTVAIYPKANDTLSIWFYRRPVDMSADTDTPDGIDEAFHTSVIVPRVVLRAFRTYPDLATDTPSSNARALQLWQQRLHAGLYGDGASKGFIDSLKKGIKRPRIRGPRVGGNLSGSDRYSRYRQWSF